MRPRPASPALAARSAAATLAVGALVLGCPGAARADQGFHTTSYDLVTVGGSGVAGTVVDIHTQGPQVYAQERYRLRGAVPGAEYTVSLTAYADAACTTVALAVPGSPSGTANAAGVVSAQRTFPPMGLTPGTLYLRWVVTGPSGPVAQTACVAVPVD